MADKVVNTEEFLNRFTQVENKIDGLFLFTTRNFSPIRTLPPSNEMKALFNYQVESFKRVKNREVILLAYSRWANGASQAEMRDEFPVSLRTINTWVGWFRNVPEAEVEKDRVGFHFHQMEEYGIPWDKYEEVMRLVEEYSVQENMELTPRMAKWAWRLQQIKNPTFNRDKAKEFIKKFVEAEQEELIQIDSKGGLKEVSQDLQYELSKWQTTRIGRTHNES